MNKKWEPNKGDRVIRHPREEELQTVRISSTDRRSQPKIFGSPMMLMYIFLLPLPEISHLWMMHYSRQLLQQQLLA